jgi:hypothetical protein
MTTCENCQGACSQDESIRFYEEFEDDDGCIEENEVFVCFDCINDDPELIDTYSNYHFDKPCDYDWPAGIHWYIEERADDWPGLVTAHENF